MSELTWKRREGGHGKPGGRRAHLYRGDEKICPAPRTMYEAGPVKAILVDAPITPTGMPYDRVCERCEVLWHKLQGTPPRRTKPQPPPKAPPPPPPPTQEDILRAFAPRR